MTIPVKALMFDIRVFLADNNLRRSTASFAVNYGSESEDVLLNALTLAPGASKQLVTPMTVSVVTLLRTTLPLQATIKLRDNTTFLVPINRLLILDADIAQIDITNPSTTESAKITVQQG